MAPRDYGGANRGIDVIDGEDEQLCLLGTGRAQHLQARCIAIIELVAEAAHEVHLRLADFERRESDVARLTLTTRLLGRRYRADGPVVVKANVPVNFMIPQLAAAPLGPSIVLYSALEDYLVAVLRTPKHRDWAQRVTGEVSAAIAVLTGQSGRRSDVECAALLWLAQVTLYDQLTRCHAEVASLDAEDLFNRPADVVRAAFAHISKPQSEAVVAQIVASDLFNHYAKNPSVAFTNEARLERVARTRAELAAELRAARAFVEDLPVARNLPQHLVNDLLGGKVPLLGGR